MARSKRWVIDTLGHGRWEVHLSSWKYFHDFIRQKMLNYTGFIWRGQRCDNWELEPTLDRELGLQVKKDQLTRWHLDNFKYAVRGRRGPNPPQIHDENDWWALGQHQGLLTPLLDWTTSPFAALYFAFVQVKKPQTKYRAVFALSMTTVETISRQITANHKGPTRPPIVECIRPLSDENARLVNQGGLFTRSPVGVSIEDWIDLNVPADNKKGTLIKLLIPKRDREEYLRTLNRMNINHLTLFPDIYGASIYCNMRFSISRY